MVTIPMATLTGPDLADNAGSSGSSPHGSGTNKETPSVVSAAVGETTSSEVISSCPALFTVDEAKDVDIDKLESEHLKIITEDGEFFSPIIFIWYYFSPQNLVGIRSIVDIILND